MWFRREIVCKQTNKQTDNNLLKITFFFKLSLKNHLIVKKQLCAKSYPNWFRNGREKRENIFYMDYIGKKC